MHTDQRQARREITNRLLLSLPPAVLKRLEPHFEWLELEAGSSIYRVGAPVKRLYFINHGFVSIVKTMQDGRTVEIGTNGNTDVVGLFALHGVETAVWESVVQISGSALRISADVLRAEAENTPELQRLIERYTHKMLSELAQTAACHRLHPLKQRFCRWLLSAQDSSGTDRLPLTHETLAMMLGVQRSGVSIVASAFQKAGVLRNHRGSLTILNRPALEADACECYELSCRTHERLFGGTNRHHNVHG